MNTIPASHIVNCFSTGGRDDLPYGFPPEYVARGANYIASDQIAPAEARGCRTHYWNRPWGWARRYADGGMPMFDFDMLPVIRSDPDPKYRRAVESFAPVVAPIVAAGNDVIPYLGGLQHSPSMLALKAQGKRDDYWRRWAEVIKPIQDANCSAAIDASALIKPDTFEWGCLCALRAERAECGRTVWVEARPPADAEHLIGWNVICREDHWQAQSGPNYLPRKALGRVIRELPLDRRDGETDPAWIARIKKELPAQVQQVRDEGCEPGFSVAWCDKIASGLVVA